MHPANGQHLNSTACHVCSASRLGSTVATAVDGLGGWVGKVPVAFSVPVQSYLRFSMSILRWLTPANLWLVTAPAYASGVDGVLAAAYGLPLLVAISAALAWVRRVDTRSWVRVLILVLALPGLLYAFYLLPDAASIIKPWLSGDSMVAVFYFALLFVCCLLYLAVAALLLKGRRVVSGK